MHPIVDRILVLFVGVAVSRFADAKKDSTADHVRNTLRRVQFLRPLPRPGFPVLIAADDDFVLPQLPPPPILIDGRPLVRERCINETRDIDATDAVQDAYGEIVPLESSGPTIRGVTSRFFDYSNQPLVLAVYQRICEENNGQFLQFDFEAECDELDSSGNVVRAERLAVFDFPRCYSTKSCNPDHDQALFEAFTLRTTEVRNSNGSTKNWTCKGDVDAGVRNIIQLNKNTTTNIACKLADAAFLQVPSIAAGLDRVQSSVAQKKTFLGLLPTNYHIVSFLDTEDYQNACETTGGTFSLADVSTKCTERSSTDRVESDIVYKTEGFPVCTDGSSNCNDEILFGDKLEKSLIDNEQFSVKDVGNKVTCIPSGAFHISSMTVVLYVVAAYAVSSIEWSSFI